MRRALLALEACKVQQYPFKADQAVQGTDWELYISQIAREVMANQDPKTLFTVRARLYELLINCIPPELILKAQPCSRAAPPSPLPRGYQMRPRWALHSVPAPPTHPRIWLATPSGCALGSGLARGGGFGQLRANRRASSA